MLRQDCAVSAPTPAAPRTEAISDQKQLGRLRTFLVASLTYLAVARAGAREGWTGGRDRCRRSGNHGIPPSQVPHFAHRISAALSSPALALNDGGATYS